MGKIEVHGRRSHRQDAGRDRRRQYRRHCLRPRPRPEDEGDRLRSVPLRRARRQDGCRQGRARRAAETRRFHHPPRAAHRQDPWHPLGQEHRQDQEGRADHQLRPGRPRRRGGAGRGDQIGPCGRRGLRRVRGGAGERQPAVWPQERGLHAAPRRLDHRSAGKRGAASGRTDLGLPAHRRGDQFAQHARGDRRGSQGDGPLDQARRASWRLRRPTYR